MEGQPARVLGRPAKAIVSEIWHEFRVLGLPPNNGSFSPSETVNLQALNIGVDADRFDSADGPPNM